jgi:hypothetical protein
MAELLSAPGSPLRPLVAGARRQRLLDEILRRFLDRPLAEHVQVASADGDALVLAADAPVWGHRIRYLAPDVLARMRQEVPSLGSVRIIVRPQPTAPPPAPGRRHPGLSPANASLLEAVSRSCGNPALARVLARLSARGRSG